MGVVAQQTATGVALGLVIIGPDRGTDEDRQLAPGRAMALAAALAIDGQAPGAVRQQ